MMEGNKKKKVNKNEVEETIFQMSKFKLENDLFPSKSYIRLSIEFYMYP